jgi:hypothetical protein
MRYCLTNNAVLFKLGGLVQPVSCWNEFAITVLASNANTGQPVLALLPPFVSVRVAAASCPSRRRAQVALECPILTLKP